jgi:hypothetical protein
MEKTTNMAESQSLGTQCQGNANYENTATLIDMVRNSAVAERLFPKFRPIGRIKMVRGDQAVRADRALVRLA